MNLNWRKPLFFCLLPVLVFLAFVGFPPPFAPPRAMRAAQEQAQRKDEEDDRPMV